jgi:hypothetical protein
MLQAVTGYWRSGNGFLDKISGKDESLHSEDGLTLSAFLQKAQGSPGKDYLVVGNLDE